MRVKMNKSIFIHLCDKEELPVKKLVVIIFAIMLIVSLQTTSYAYSLASPIAPVYSDFDYVTDTAVSSDYSTDTDHQDITPVKPGNVDNSPYAPKTSDNFASVLFCIMSLSLLTVCAISKKTLVKAEND